MLLGSEKLEMTHQPMKIEKQAPQEQGFAQQSRAEAQMMQMAHRMQLEAQMQQFAQHFQPQVSPGGHSGTPSSFSQDGSPNHMDHAPHDAQGPPGYPSPYAGYCGPPALAYMMPHMQGGGGYAMTPFPVQMAYVPCGIGDQPGMPGFAPQVQRGGVEQTKRPKRRSRKKVEPVVPERGIKVFVGGLGPSSTSATLRAYFGRFGEILDCSVLADSSTKRSRGFGFVEFAGSIPAGVIGTDHIIGERRCGVREYHYNPTM